MVIERSGIRRERRAREYIGEAPRRPPSGGPEGGEHAASVSAETVARLPEDVPVPPPSPNADKADYLNGPGLGTLVALHRRARRGGGQLTLVNMAAHLGEPPAGASPEADSGARRKAGGGAGGAGRVENTEP
jgi:hypothetical protein